MFNLKYMKPLPIKWSYPYSKAWTLFKLYDNIDIIFNIDVIFTIQPLNPIIIKCWFNYIFSTNSFNGWSTINFQA